MYVVFVILLYCHYKLIQLFITFSCVLILVYCQPAAEYIAQLHNILLRVAMTEFDGCYGSDVVMSYATNHVQEMLTQAFMLPSVSKFLKATVAGKKVLDVGCGDGYWSYQAAKHGAKSVEAFDIQEDMVIQAKSMTSQFSMVHVQVGDIMAMPLEDNAFDVAMSMYVTCSVAPTILSKHFKELYRVLAPGGKAVIISLAEQSFDKLYLTVGADKTFVRGQIARCLEQLPTNPTMEQVNKTFDNLHDVIKVFFATDSQGCVYQVNDVNQLANGAPVWSKTPIITFPNHFYKDEYLMEQTTVAGFCVDQVENIFTEERRLECNKALSNHQISKTVVDHPLVYMYHISKPNLRLKK